MRKSKPKVVAWITKYEYTKIIKKKGQILDYTAQARPNAVYIPLYDHGERYARNGTLLK